MQTQTISSPHVRLRSRLLPARDFRQMLSGSTKLLNKNGTARPGLRQISESTALMPTRVNAVSAASRKTTSMSGTTTPKHAMQEQKKINPAQARISTLTGPTRPEPFLRHGPELTGSRQRQAATTNRQTKLSATLYATQTISGIGSKRNASARKRHHLAELCLIMLSGTPLQA